MRTLQCFWVLRHPARRISKSFLSRQVVDAALRSVSHPEVFAAGDSATLQHTPHPKSGVYAVRHAAVLAENLKRAIQEEGLVRYQPQASSLIILSCGAKYAIASRGGLTAEGAWVWRWKDWIDRRWVESFRPRAG